MLLSVNEAAAALGIGRTLMYELLGSGRVESVFVGRLHRVPADALAAFVEKLRADCPAGRSTGRAVSNLVPSPDGVQR
jgi:excisionase family DNA binding protein